MITNNLVEAKVPKVLKGERCLLFLIVCSLSPSGGHEKYFHYSAESQYFSQQRAKTCDEESICYPQETAADTLESQTAAPKIHKWSTERELKHWIFNQNP